MQGFDHPKYGTLLQPPPAREPAQRQQRSSNAHRAHRPLCAGRSALPWAAGGGGPRGGAEGLPATHCDGRAQVRAQEELGVGGVGVWGEKILGLCKLETIFENQTKTKCFKFSQPLRTYTSAPPPTDVCLSHTYHARRRRVCSHQLRRLAHHLGPPGWAVPLLGASRGKRPHTLPPPALHSPCPERLRMHCRWFPTWPRASTCQISTPSS